MFMQQLHACRVRSGFLPERTVHLHPIRPRDPADPRERSELDAGRLIDALQVLRGEGYRELRIAGGEPLAYSRLPLLVAAARAMGWRVTLVTDGWLVGPSTNALLDHVNGVAIRFDGPPTVHNLMRGRHDAFARAAEALRHVAARGCPVSADITLTSAGLPELPDLAYHLVGLGAQTLHVRPLRRSSGAREAGDDSFLSTRDQARLYLLCLALREELPAEVTVHCALTPARSLWMQRDAYLPLMAESGARPEAIRPLADLVNPLVITEAGALKPVAHDFAPAYDVGRLDDCHPTALRRYKAEALPAFQHLVGRALAGLQQRIGLIDWSEHCARMSDVPPALLQRRAAEAPGLAPLCLPAPADEMVVDAA